MHNDLLLKSAHELIACWFRHLVVGGDVVLLEAEKSWWMETAAE
jgi:hypothetical protein